MQTVGGVLPSSTLQHTHTQTVGWFIQIIIIYKLKPRLKYRSQYESLGFSPLFHSLSLSLPISLSRGYCQRVLGFYVTSVYFSHVNRNVFFAIKCERVNNLAFSTRRLSKLYTPQSENTEPSSVKPKMLVKSVYHIIIKLQVGNTILKEPKSHSKQHLNREKT